MTARPVEDRGLIHPEECAPECCPKPVTDRRRVVTRLLAATALHRPAKAELDAAYDEARTCGLLDSPGVRDIGLVGDEQIGYVLVEEGPWEVRIDDPQALRAWSEGLGLTFRQVECALFSYRELGHWVHEETGDVLVPPGVARQRSSRRHLRVKPTDDALDVIQQHATAQASGRLADLRAAVAELDVASEGMRGECRDQVIAVVRALLDDLPKDDR